MTGGRDAAVAASAIRIPNDGDKPRVAATPVQNFRKSRRLRPPSAPA